MKHILYFYNLMEKLFQIKKKLKMELNRGKGAYP